MEDMATWNFLGGIPQTKCLAGLRKAVGAERHFRRLGMNTRRIWGHIFTTDDAGTVRHGSQLGFCCIGVLCLHVLGSSTVAE